jgi:hypothetical protein
MVCDVGDDPETGRPSVLITFNTKKGSDDHLGLLSFEVTKSEAYDWAQRLYCPVRVTVELQSEERSPGYEDS